MKLFPQILSLILIVSFVSPSFAQSGKSFEYPADLILKNGTNVEKKGVIISQSNGFLSINFQKQGNSYKTFQSTEIKELNYNYSDKPQIKEALLTTLLLDSFLMGLPFFFTKTKRHWLIVATEKEAVLLELRKENYRQVLLDLSNNGFNIEDSGDRDRKQKPLVKPKTPVDFVVEDSCLPDFAN